MNYMIIKIYSVWEQKFNGFQMKKIEQYLNNIKKD